MFHVLCLGLVLALVGDMMLVGLRALEGDGSPVAAKEGGAGGKKWYGWGLDQVVGLSKSFLSWG